MPTLQINDLWNDSAKIRSPFLAGGKLDSAAAEEAMKAGKGRVTPIVLVKQHFLA